jgi:hypothetical protein
MQIIANNISLTKLREELANFITYFGYEEKLSTGSIDTVNTWTETTAGTGATSADGYMRVATGANNGSAAKLESKRNFGASSARLGTDASAFNKFILEFSGKFSSVADLGTETMVGWTGTSGNERGDNNTCGFGIKADGTLQAFSEKAAGSTDTDLAATATDHHLFRIEMTASETKFYIDESLVATHAQSVEGAFLVINIHNAAAADKNLTIRKLRAWFEE